MTNRKTEGANLEPIAANCAQKCRNQRKKYVHWEMRAPSLTTQSRSFTTLRCTRPSSVKATPQAHVSASMEIFARLPTVSLKFQSIWLRDLTAMPTSICTTLRRLGVRTRSETISERSASMLIIGRISVASHTSILTGRNSALPGTLSTRL